MARQQKPLEESRPVYPVPDEDETDLDTSHYVVSTTGVKEHSAMGMIDPTEWALENSHEVYALPDGSEYLLRIVDVRVASRDDGHEYYTVRFEVPSEPYSKEITDWFDIPHRDLDAKRLNTAKQKLLHFMQCFAIDLTRPSNPTEDWAGQEGWCLLSMSKTTRYGEQNRIAMFIRAR